MKRKPEQEIETDSDTDEKNQNFFVKQYPAPTANNDLFDNPMVNSAKLTLSEEFQAKHKKMGEELFKMNFEKGMLEDQTQVDEVFTQLKCMLRSGLHPSYLTYEEKHFLECKLGEKWYETFGYMEIDTKRVNI